jgi:hypothetical protein
MKRITAYLLLLFTGLTYGQAWQEMNDFPIEMMVHFSFATQTHGYVMTSATPNDSRMFKYDPVLDSWEEIGSFPVLSEDYAEVVLDNIPYVLTADNNIGEATIWGYEEFTDDWSVVTTTIIGGDPFCGFTGAMFGIDNKLYVHTSAGNENFRSYDLGLDTWEILVDANANGECGTQGFSVGNKGYLLFSTEEFGGPLSKNLWEYNSTTEEWTQRPDYPGFVEDSFDYPRTIFVINDIAYVGMTYLESNFHRFDPAQGTWQTIQACGYHGSRAAGFVIGDIGYVAGGSAYDTGTGGNMLVDDVWKLDPELLSVTSEDPTTIHFAPNPVLNNLVFHGLVDEVEYRIYDVVGSLITTGVTHNRSVSVDELSAGMYFVQISSDKQSAVQRFLKL